MKAHTAKKRAAEAAADTVREAILRGQLEPGSDLPGERDLAEQLGVSRLTLRAAITRLEAEGLVMPVQGSGTRVLDFRTSGGVDLMGYLAAQAIAGGVVPVGLLSDLMELRRMLATELMALITERATDQELIALRAHLGKQAALVDQPEAFMAADLHFARLMIQASHNLALELLFNTVVRVLDGHPGLKLAFQANAAAALGVYSRLLDLVEQGDPEIARRLAGRLLTRLDRSTLNQLSRLVDHAPEES